MKCASRIRNLNLAEWRRSGRLTGTTPLSAAAPLIQIQAEKLPLARVKSAARPAIVILFIAYGAYTAFISGAERAFIVESSPSGLKGTILGLYGMIQGIGLLLSSVIAGHI